MIQHSINITHNNTCGDIVPLEDNTNYTEGYNWNQSSWSNGTTIAEMQDHEKSIAGEIALFRAVIMQALLDSVSKSKRTEDKIAKHTAVQWFNRDNEDFITVCSLAQLNYNWVLQKSLKAIANGCKWRKDVKQKQITGNRLEIKNNVGHV